MPLSIQNTEGHDGGMLIDLNNIQVENPVNADTSNGTSSFFPFLSEYISNIAGANYEINRLNEPMIDLTRKFDKTFLYY